MLKDRINEDLKNAMRQKQATRLAALRLVRAAIIEREKDGSGRELSDDDVLGFIQKEVKQARETLDAYRGSAAHAEQAAEMEARIAVLEAYLPHQMDEGEIRTFVTTYIEREKPGNKGDLMKGLMAEVNGRADKKLVSRIANELWG